MLPIAEPVTPQKTRSLFYERIQDFARVFVRGLVGTQVEQTTLNQLKK
jgi:hypothetical protein